MDNTIYYYLYNKLFIVALNGARILPLFMLLPYLSQSILTGLFKFVLAFLLGQALWYAPETVIRQLETEVYTIIIFKEVIIGLMLAVILCLPFWTLHAMGSLIDNQRGATLSSTLSPLSGVDTSELANLFNLLAVAIIIEAGGITTVLEALQQSYQLWPPLSETIPQTGRLVTYIGLLMRQTIRLSAPVITVFLISEFFFCLLARYTPQTNAFSLALSLKTLIGFFVLLLYVNQLFPFEVLRLGKLLLPLR